MIAGGMGGGGGGGGGVGGGGGGGGGVGRGGGGGGGGVVARDDDLALRRGPLSLAALGAAWARCLALLLPHPHGGGGTSGDGSSSSRSIVAVGGGGGGGAAAASSGSSDELLWRRLTHLISAQWAASPMNALVASELPALTAQQRRGAARCSLRFWRRWCDARHALRRTAQRHFSARVAWKRSWRAMHAWRAHASQRADAQSLLRRVEDGFALRRMHHRWLLSLVRLRRLRVLLAVGTGVFVRDALARCARAWRRRARLLRRLGSLRRTARAHRRGVALSDGFWRVCEFAAEEGLWIERLQATAEARAREWGLAGGLRRLLKGAAAARAAVVSASSLEARVGFWARHRRPVHVFAKWAARAALQTAAARRGTALRRAADLRRCRRALLGVWARTWAREWRPAAMAAAVGADRRRRDALACWRSRASELRATGVSVARVRRLTRKTQRTAAIGAWRRHGGRRAMMGGATAVSRHRRLGEAVARLSAHARCTRAIAAWGATVPVVSEEVQRARRAGAAAAKQRRVPAGARSPAMHGGSPGNVGVLSSVLVQAG